MAIPLKHYLDAHEYINRHMKIGLKKLPKPKSLCKLGAATRRRRPNYLLLFMGLRMTKYYDLRPLNRLDIRSLHTKKIKDKATSRYFGFNDLKNRCNS